MVGKTVGPLDLNSSKPFDVEGIEKSPKFSRIWLWAAPLEMIIKQLIQTQCCVRPFERSRADDLAL